MSKISFKIIFTIELYVKLNYIECVQIKKYILTILLKIMFKIMFIELLS